MKRIILCSDGSGNSGGKRHGTNVWKIYRAIDRRGHGGIPGRGLEQLAIYDDGSGTSDFKIIKSIGRMFGWGLGRNIRALYAALVRCYEPGDVIYLFGFSRGAFAVRSLAGMISRCGILDQKKVVGKSLQEQVYEAYSKYRTGVAEADAFRRTFGVTDSTHAPDGAITVHFVGVWDTIDPVGVPFNWMRKAIHAVARQFQRPHDHDVTTRMRYGYHAVALDDEREVFGPILWDEHKATDHQHIEQVWFSGAHSNVGGGYPKSGMSAIALDWMMEKAATAESGDGVDRGLQFLELERNLARDEADVHSKLYDTRAGMAAYYRYRPRQVESLCKQHCVGRAKIHDTVFQRVELATQHYAPEVIPLDFDVVVTDPRHSDYAAAATKMLNEQRLIRAASNAELQSKTKLRMVLYHVLFSMTMGLLALAGYLIVSGSLAGFAGFMPTLLSGAGVFGGLLLWRQRIHSAMKRVSLETWRLVFDAAQAKAAAGVPMDAGDVSKGAADASTDVLPVAARRDGSSEVRGAVAIVQDNLGRDLRDARRSLQRNPLFSFVAITSLALGIATATTIFSVFEAMLLRSFPFDEPDQLVSIGEVNERTDNRVGFTHRRYMEWREGTVLYSDIATYASHSVSINDTHESVLIDGQLISWNLFPMLGITPRLGRLFDITDDQPGAPGAVLLSDAVWTRVYESDANILGQAITLNGRMHTVIGVMPPRFKFPEMSEIWLPIAQYVNSTTAPDEAFTILGRMKPGGQVDQANAEVALYSKRSPRPDADGSNDVWTGEARSLTESFIGPEERVITAAMMGAVMFLLLLACANVANLWLTRAVGRRREFAVRAAIGAGRRQLIRQLLIEAMLLALIAGVIAIPLAWEALRLFAQTTPPSDPYPYYVEWSLNLPTLLFAFGASLMTGILFGLVPALDVSTVRPHEELKEGGRGTSGGNGRLRNGLVVVEVALALMLLVGASLFVKTFLKLQEVDLGYDPSRIMTMRFYLPGTTYDSVAARTRAIDDIVRRVTEIPGVEAATISDLIPLEDDGGALRRAITDVGEAPRGQEPSLFYVGVAGDWFGTFDVGLVAGRSFFSNELRDGEPVAIINETMANRFWPDTDPLGRRFRLGGDTTATWFSVIAVAPDMRTVKLDENEPTPPTAYVPHPFLRTRDYGLMVRTQVVPASITQSVREILGLSVPVIPLFKVWDMEDVKRLSFWMYRVWGTMFAIFGAIALFLAAIGVYAVISNGVTQRTREIGVRIALGAQSSNVVGLIVRQGMTLAVIGIGFGVVGALWMSHAVAELLIGVSPIDFTAYAGVALFLGVVAFMACFVPALRAAKVDPSIAMRDDPTGATTTNELDWAARMVATLRASVVKLRNKLPRARGTLEAKSPFFNDSGDQVGEHNQIGKVDEFYR